MQLLPIGSVVLLGNEDCRTLIFGRCYRDDKTGEEYDYVGCEYPAGIQSCDQVRLFNQRDIKIVFSIGYQDMEEFLLRAELEKGRQAT